MKKIISLLNSTERAAHISLSHTHHGKNENCCLSVESGLILALLVVLAGGPPSPVILQQRDRWRTGVTRRLNCSSISCHLLITKSVHTRICILCKFGSLLPTHPLILVRLLLRWSQNLRNNNTVWMCLPVRGQCNPREDGTGRDHHGDGWMTALCTK